MAKAPTVYDVADRAGVSIATVSRVLRRPDAVRPETRERVLETVRDLGYVPSGSARGLAGRRTGVLGLFLPGTDSLEDPAGDSTSPPPETGSIALTSIPLIDDRFDRSDPPATSLYFDEVLRGAEMEAWKNGFALMVAAGRGSSREAMLNDIAGRVDGLAVLAQTVSPELLAHVARRIPVVVMADSRPDESGENVDHVGVDNEGGMRALTRHVVTAHRVESLLYIAGPSDSPDEAGRRAGLEAGLADAGFDTARLRVVAGTFGRARGREVARELLAGSPSHGVPGVEHPGADSAQADLPDAVICANDQTALGVLDVFAENGVDVPGRVLVTGFDGIDAGRFSVPRLTTVRQPMSELGRAAVRAIVARMADPTEPPRRLTLPVQVFLRESCPPANAAKSATSAKTATPRSR